MIRHFFGECLKIYNISVSHFTSFFTLIAGASSVLKENKNGQPTQIDQNSRWVELAGIEPASKHIHYKPSTCLFMHYLSE